MGRPHLMQIGLDTATPVPRRCGAALDQLRCLASNGILLPMKLSDGGAASCVHRHLTRLSELPRPPACRLRCGQIYAACKRATLTHHRATKDNYRCRESGCSRLLRSRTMPDYRAYIVGKDGRFESFEIIAADSDEQALKVAEKLVDGHDVELWHLAGNCSAQAQTLVVHRTKCLFRRKRYVGLEMWRAGRSRQRGTLSEACASASADCRVFRPAYGGAPKGLSITA